MDNKPDDNRSIINVELLSIRTGLGLAAAFGLLMLLSNVFAIGVDDADAGAWHRSGAKLITDHKTGMQYLAAEGGGITPRLDADGRQMRVNH